MGLNGYICVHACSDVSGVRATKQVLDEVGMPNASVADCEVIRRICHVLSQRSACLVAAGTFTSCPYTVSTMIGLESQRDLASGGLAIPYQKTTIDE